MPNQLKISTGHHTDKGRKEINQDFYGIHIPKEPLLSSKGIAIALADGISSSHVSQIASKTAITDLTSSGNLNILKNEEVKNLLIGYYADLDNLLIQLEINRNYALQRGFQYDDDIKFGYQQADYLKQYQIYQSII